MGFFQEGPVWEAGVTVAMETDGGSLHIWELKGDGGAEAILALGTLSL